MKIICQTYGSVMKVFTKQILSTCFGDDLFYIPAPHDITLSKSLLHASAMVYNSVVGALIIKS